jgi:DNA-binding response OmpR family regulator/peptidoglycan hydrolase CwlO-like protein
MASKTLVILEPDEKFVKALKLYFRGSDYDVKAFVQPDEALQAAKDDSPTASLLSLDPDDSAAGDFVRNFANETRRPAIVMSPKKNDTDLFMGGVKTVGGAAYIKKPFIKKTILQLLDDVLAEWTEPEADDDDAIDIELDDGGDQAAEPAATGQKQDGVQFNDLIAEIDQEVDTFFAGDSDEKPAEAVSPPEIEQGDAFETVVLEDEPAAPKPEPVVTSAPVMDETPSGEWGMDDGRAKQLKARVKEMEKELLARTDEAKTAARDKERIEREFGAKDSEHTSKIRSLEKQVEDYEEDIKKRKQLVSQLSESIKSLNEEIEEKETKIRDEASGFESQLHGLQEQAHKLTENVDQRTHEVEDKVDEIGRHTRRIGDLEQENEELQQNLGRTTEERNAAETRIQDLEGRLKQTQDELDGTKSTLSSTQGDLENTRNELASTQSDLENTKNELATTQSDLGNTKATLEDAQRRLQEAKQAFEQGLSAIG